MSSPSFAACCCPGPILLVFTLFFVSADTVFAAYVSSVFDPDIFNAAFKFIWRGFLIIGIAWAAAGGLSYGLLHQSVWAGQFGRSAFNRICPQRAVAGLYGSDRYPDHCQYPIPLLCSCSNSPISLVDRPTSGFQVELAVSPMPTTLGGGFFELVTVAVMTLALVLFIHWLTTRNGRKQTRLFNALSSLMSALVMVMLISAFQRLLLYEQAFGYTWLRLWIHTFMIWLGFVFVWFLITLWRTPAPTSAKAEPAEVTIRLRTGIPKYFAFGIFLAAIGFIHHPQPHQSRPPHRPPKSSSLCRDRRP